MIPLAIEIATALLTASGMAYGLLALWGARAFHKSTTRQPADFAPGESAP